MRSPDRWSPLGNSGPLSLGAKNRVAARLPLARRPLEVGSWLFHSAVVLIVLAALGTGGPVQAAPLISNTPSAEIIGDQGGSLFGENAITAGDVNVDGFSDLLVGARFYAHGQTTEGRAYLYYGTSAGLSTTPAKIFESDEAGALLGSAVACLGDVNGDGWDDFAIGIPMAGAGDEGAVHVYYGDNHTIFGSPDVVLVGSQADALFGQTVKGAGDVNGDGVQDLIVGSQAFSNGQAGEGCAQVFLGSANGIATTPAWTVESNVAGVRFGSQVSTAGDVNGDGFGDVLVAAFRFTNGETSEGKVFLYLGSAHGLATTPAWQVEGNQESAAYGSAIANAGDVNGDGYADFLVGAQSFDNGQANEGRAFLYLGSPTPISTTPVAIYESNQVGGALGNALGAVGDLNGDGMADFAIGAFGWDGNQADEGAVLVFLGVPAGVPTSAAFTFLGDQLGELFGKSVVTAGDANGDGFSDIMVGAQSFDGTLPDVGAVFIYAGAAGPPQTNPSWLRTGAHDFDRYGQAVEIIGDINADGFDDAAVGAPQETVGPNQRGVVRIYLGSETGLSDVPFQTLPADNTTGSTVLYGYGLSRAGDVNADGYDDLLISDPNYREGNFVLGMVELWKGGSAGLALFASFVGSPLSQEQLGYSLSSADIDGDGFSDIILSGHGFGETAGEGRVRVFCGSAGGPDAFADWEARGGYQNANFGRAVTSAGDVNGDGYDDLLVSMDAAPGGPIRAGQVSLYLGSAFGLAATPAWTRAGTMANQAFGLALATVGDANGDGFADVAITSAAYPSGPNQAGMVEVFGGNATGLETTPSFLLQGTTDGETLGSGLATAGDVNDDGFSDLIVGRPSLGLSGLGAADLYLGSLTGLTSPPAWSTPPGTVGDQIGASVSGAGDVNGDGFSDLLIGAPLGWYDQEKLGSAQCFHGNDEGGVDRALMQLLANNAARISTGGRNVLQTDTFHIAMMYRSAAGRTRARAEVAFQEAGLSGWADTAVGTFEDTGSPVLGEGSAIRFTATFTTPSMDIVHWRVHVRSASPYFPYGPWLMLQGNSPTETDLRQLPLTAEVINENPAVESSATFATIAPNPISSTARIAFTLPDVGHAALDIMDVQGRRIARLVDGELGAATHAYTWNTRDEMGRPVPSGVYFVRLVTGSACATRRIVIRR